MALVGPIERQSLKLTLMIVDLFQHESVILVQFIYFGHFFIGGQSQKLEMDIWGKG